jgi:N-acetylneuraminate synthase
MARLIAEIGSNHNRDRERALRLIDDCADAGWDAIKLQVFRVEDLFAPEVLAARGDLRTRRAWEFPLELLDPIADRCRARGIALGATPFGLWAVEPLAARADFLKVASYELLWDDLIRACAATGLPLIISTGMATLEEVEAAVAVARGAGARELTLLHCVSGYPTPPDQANLAAIETLRAATGCRVGWSDHTGSAAVVRRAIERWAATDVEIHVDLDGEGNEAGPHNWMPGAVGAIGAAADAPEADGDGRKAPMPVEAPDVAWRSDPADGLRPLRAVRPPAPAVPARSAAAGPPGPRTATR